MNSSFSFEELIKCGNGELFGEGNAKLPQPPMLMFDRITHISKEGGEYGKGSIIAELDIKPELWFFKCHFKDDPVMPGCLGLDAMWQLIGFYLAWLGGTGRGRAIGVGNVKYNGQVFPDVKKVKYKINLSRIIARKLYMGIADAIMLADDIVIYEAINLRVGLFADMKK
jgi:3-hydroxyacyl-[acyl-carrier protein] dehydratase/trans-2-decenoyl-[acyl-carrier protein] isomerase